MYVASAMCFVWDKKPDLPTKFAQMKEKMSELMRMVQQLVVEGGQNSSGHSQGGPQTKNENHPLPIQEQAIMYCPRVTTKKWIFQRIRL